MPVSNSLIARAAFIVCLVVAAFWLAWQVVDILLLLFAAVLVALALHALAAPIARVTGLSPRLALIPTILILLVLMGLSSWLFGSVIRGQVVDLIARLPGAWQSVQDRFEILNVSDALREKAEAAVPSGTAVLSFLSGFTMNVANAALGVFLILVGGIYLAVQPRLYRDGVLRLLPTGSRGWWRDRLDRAAVALRGFLKAQLVAMVVVGVVTSAGLALIGVPSALALGLFAGLAEFVPMVGPVAAAVPALLLALNGGVEEAGWTLLLFVVVQQVESNILAPMLQQEMVNVPAAVTLFAVVAFGTVLGPLGVLLATPLTVLIFALMRPAEEAGPT